jgi:hypothetical protein
LGSGAAGGLAQSATRQLLEDGTVDLKQLAKDTAVGAVGGKFGEAGGKLAGAGANKAARIAGASAAGAAASAGTQVIGNAIEGRELSEGVGQAAVTGSIVAGAAETVRATKANPQREAERIASNESALESAGANSAAKDAATPLCACDEGASVARTDSQQGRTKVIGRIEDTAVAKEWPGYDVLDIPEWTQAKNAEWVNQGIKEGQVFYTASPEAGNLVQTSGRYAGQPTVFANEIQQLKAAGYVKVGDYYVPAAKAAGFKK